MTADIAARVAEAAATVPAVAYLSPHPRSLLSGFGPDHRRGRGVTVSVDEHGYTIEIRVAVRADTTALTAARAVRDAAREALAERHRTGSKTEVGPDADTPIARITVTITALV